MIRNYFKIALRQLRKQKMYSAIKIGGFALSIAACLLIALFIKDELSYDKTFPDGDRIYRIVGAYNDNGTIEKGTDFPPPMARAIKQDFPEVEKAGRFMPNTLFAGAGSNYLRRTDQQQNTYENGFTYADQEVLNILSIPMVYGDRAHALSEPNTMVISQKKADKYFPNQNPIGKTMWLNDDKSKPYKIGGVMQDFPATSYLQYDFFLTLTGVELWQGEQAGWGSSNYPIYLKLRTGTNVVQFEKKLTSNLIKNYYIPNAIASGQSPKEANDLASKASLQLQPVSDIHLKSYDIHDTFSHGDIRFVWLFGAIACFILIIACINFINLSTAKSANRAKEVGLRKVVGSHRSSLVRQFLTESLLFSFLSFVLGLLLAWALLPYFNTLSAKSLTIPWRAWWLMPMMISAAFIIGIFAGLYPSFYLSAFKPINVLKGQVSRGSKNSILRNGLVVFQFTTSIILIIGTLVIYKQTHFILNKEVGFDKDQVLIIQGTNTLGEQVKSFKTELLKLSSVKSASISDYLPIAGTKRNGNTFYNEGKKKEESGVDTQFWIVDNDYLQTMGIKVVSGRNFSPQMPSDSQGVVINQTLANKLNLKDPVGKRITNGYGVFNVLGVVQDFNFESMRDQIGGLCMILGTSPSIVSIKVKTADVKNLVPVITAVWKKFAPAQPIRYTFLDESFANMYADVQRMGSIFTSFAILAIIIACLGLFALSAFMAEQRNKEIGIRKVLGASVSGITTMLSKDFVKLVIIAIVVASPIAWWAMTKWLQDFVYRITISWWMIAIAGLAAIVIALITVSFQAIKAALANPVKSLRTE
jgi:putative ABC transport system permease protein